MRLTEIVSACGQLELSISKACKNCEINGIMLLNSRTVNASSGAAHDTGARGLCLVLSFDAGRDAEQD